MDIVDIIAVDNEQEADADADNDQLKSKADLLSKKTVMCSAKFIAHQDKGIKFSFVYSSQLIKCPILICL